MKMSAQFVISKMAACNHKVGFISLDLFESIIFSSVVPKSSLIPFHPAKEPYKSYSQRLKHFLTDAGVRRATNFHNKGEIPKLFKWLKLAETGYLDPTAEDSGSGRETAEIEIEISSERVKRPSSSASKKTRTDSSSPKKRGRKPKNQAKPLTEEAVVSPKPLNPSEMMKIEALISAANSASQNHPIIKEQVASQ